MICQRPITVSIFQSTHPLRGATAAGAVLDLDLVISIHAPLAGCDERLRRRPDPYQHFNPRTPCGVRPDGSPGYISPFGFQSTHPLRGATPGRAGPPQRAGISIHAPLAGCDRNVPRGHRHRRDFNPRTPCGVRPRPNARTPSVKRISIHAPLAGCDSKIAEIFPANLRKSYKISAKPNKERRCHVLGKGKAAAISDLARCEPPGENRNTSGSHQIMSAPSGA